MLNLQNTEQKSSLCLVEIQYLPAVYAGRYVKSDTVSK